MTSHRSRRSSWTTASDESLLAGIRDGDHAAFAELYRRMSRQLLIYVQRRLVDHAQSEEVLQEVFLHVWGFAAGARAVDAVAT